MLPRLRTFRAPDFRAGMWPLRRNSEKAQNVPPFVKNVPGPYSDLLQRLPFLFRSASGFPSGLWGAQIRAPVRGCHCRGRAGRRAQSRTQAARGRRCCCRAAADAGTQTGLRILPGARKPSRARSEAAGRLGRFS